MRKKRVRKEKGWNRREIRQDFSGGQILELMKEGDRPFLLREILRRLGLPKEKREQAREYLQDLEWKIEKCHRAGTKAVVMPASHLPGTEDLLPEINAFRNEVLRLKQKYPQTIITTDKYLKTLDAPHSCNTSSLRVDADGQLYYPCQMCVERTIDASKEPILEFLRSEKAMECREKMKSCDINCHSYLYFAMDSSLSLRSTLSAVMPYVRSFI
jgi:hypothetical protein